MSEQQQPAMAPDGKYDEQDQLSQKVEELDLDTLPDGSSESSPEEAASTLNLNMNLPKGQSAMGLVLFGPKPPTSPMLTECVGLLGLDSKALYHAGQQESVSDEYDLVFGPLLEVTKAIVDSAKRIELSSSPASNFNVLLYRVGLAMEGVEADDQVADIFNSLLIQPPRPSTTTHLPDDQAKRLVREKYILRDAILRFYNKWQKEFPDPDPAKARWPQDFDDETVHDIRDQIRRIIRYMNLTTGDAADSLTDDRVKSIVDSFLKRKEFLVRKGDRRAIAEQVLREEFELEKELLAGGGKKEDPKTGSRGAARARGSKKGGSTEGHKKKGGSKPKGPNKKPETSGGGEPQ